MEKLAPGAGITVVASEVYDKAATDLTAEVTKLKAAGVEAILNWSIEPAQAIVIKNARQIGFNGPIFQSHGFGNIQYARAAGAAAEGVIFPAGRILVAESLPASHPQKAVLVAYKSGYEARFKEDVSHLRRPRLGRLPPAGQGHQGGRRRPGPGARRHREHPRLRGHRRGLQLLADRPQRARRRRLRAAHGEGRQVRRAAALTPRRPWRPREPMTLALVLQYVVAGLTYGTIYAVVGVGFNIVYSATGIINFAQGEFVMLGGMTAVTLRGVPAAAGGHRPGACW